MATDGEDVAAVFKNIRKLAPFGVGVEVKEGYGSDVERLRGGLKELVARDALVVVDGLDVEPKQLVELMTAFAPREKMTDWSKMPLLPENDGVEGAQTVNCPGEPLVRYLGNVVDEKTGEPLTLLADIGYEWHQDSSTSSFSVLYCITAPEEGAETLFASASTLFSRLSPEQKKFAETAIAHRSNRCNAGGPAAFDAHWGLRMSHTGCRRIRSAHHRRSTWKLNESTRPVSGVDEVTGERLFWGAAKNFDHFEGMDAEESQAKMEELMHTAFFGVGATVPEGEYDSDMRTMSRTQFPEDVVLTAKWRPRVRATHPCMFDTFIFTRTRNRLSDWKPKPRSLLFASDGRDLVKQSCASLHDTGGALQQRRTTDDAHDHAVGGRKARKVPIESRKFEIVYISSLPKSTVNRIRQERGRQIDDFALRHFCRSARGDQTFFRKRKQREDASERTSVFVVCV